MDFCGRGKFMLIIWPFELSKLCRTSQRQDMPSILTTIRNVIFNTAFTHFYFKVTARWNAWGWKEFERRRSRTLTCKLPEQAPARSDEAGRQPQAALCWGTAGWCNLWALVIASNNAHRFICEHKLESGQTLGHLLKESFRAIWGPRSLSYWVFRYTAVALQISP